jgi:hypothetical protein
MSSQDSKLFDYTPAQLLQTMMMKVTTEDSLKYLDKAYSSVNPGMLRHAIELGRSEFQKLEKKTDQKRINCYLTLGGDSFNQSFWNGAIATLLWLQEYIDIAKSSFNIKQEEVDVCKQVLSRIGLPKVTDAEGSSNCRHYASFLGSLAHWCTSGVTSIKTSGGAHTNMEMVRLLASTAQNHFPSVPFAAYFIGQIKNNNIFKCAEHMGKLIKFSDYMTTESILLNEPKFVVQTSNSPIVGVVGHPLTNTVVGQTTGTGGFEWLGLFEASDEFERICVSNGFTSQEVKKYLLGIDRNEHNKLCQQKDKLALFVESQHIAKQALELREQKLVK